MTRRLSGNDGFLMLMTMMFLVMLVILTASFLMAINATSTNATAQVNNVQALYLAEAGINKAEWYLLNVAPDGSLNGSWRTSSDYPSGTPATYSTCSVGSCAPKTESLGSGTFTIWAVTSGANINITSQGTVNSITRTVRVQITSASVNNLPTTGLVAWWKMDEGSGTTVTDSSGNGHNGTFNGSPTWTTDRLGGGALNFNDNGAYVDINSTSLAAAGISDWTESAWVNVPNGIAHDGAVISNKANGSGPTLTLTVGQLSGHPIGAFYLHETGSTSGLYGSVHLDDSWHHIVGVRSGSDGVNGGTQYDLYVDGVKDDANLSNSSNDSASSTADWTIGRDMGPDWNNYFKGKIDDVRVYNRALSAGEIRQLAGSISSLYVIPTSWEECSLTSCA